MAVAPRYVEAAELLTQAERVLTLSYEELLRMVRPMGQTVFKDAPKADPLLWQACMEEWGHGPGYKSRVAAHNREWFKNEARRKLEEGPQVLIAREWTRALANVTALLEPNLQYVQLLSR